MGEPRDEHGASRPLRAAGPDPEEGAVGAPLRHQGDLELVQRALEGAVSDRDRLFERLRCVPRFVAACHRRLGAPLDRQSLEDLAQNVLLAVWRRLPDFRGEAAIETFAYPFCRFETLNAVRRWQRRSPHEAPPGSDGDHVEPSVDMPVDRGLLEEETLHLLAALSPSEARVVHLRHFEGREVSEIAALLSISASSVKTHYYRALEKLRARLAPRSREVQP